MIEREQHRVDSHTLQRGLATHLKEQQSNLVERIAQTAFERGYAHYIPDLREVLESVVRTISRGIAEIVATERVSAFRPGDEFGNDPLASAIHGERLALHSRGVRGEVFFALLQQARAAYAANCRDSGLENHDACQALIAVCFDRIELSVIADCVANDHASGVHKSAIDEGYSADSANGSSDTKVDTASAAAERCKVLVAANERMRRELDRRMRVDEERELYYRALLHSQKLEAVGSLAGGVAHDLNNLFQVIRCDVDMLRKRSDSTSFGMLEEISHVTERAVGLVRQLLLFSRKQPMARRILDVGEVVRDLLRLLRRVMPENIRLFSEVEEKLPLVRADLSAIEQLVLNLVINARDSMPQGGTIHLSVSRQRRVPPDRIRAATSMQQIAIIVRDDGIGMPEDVLARIFDPFFTTKSHSSGLGLSVVHGVAEEHGGWIEVTSRLGQGSCFAIYLPVLDAATHPDTTSQVIEADVCLGSGEHLLLVEDEEVVRRALGRELTRYGYHVQAVGSAEEALEIYRRAPGHFDCVISDGTMPGISGPEMVLEMLKDNAQQRAIFISGYAPTMECWKDLQHRGFRLLAKPFGTIELISALKETLADGREVAAETLRTNYTRRES